MNLDDLATRWERYKRDLAEVEARIRREAKRAAEAELAEDLEEIRTGLKELVAQGACTKSDIRSACRVYNNVAQWRRLWGEDPVVTVVEVGEPNSWVPFLEVDWENRMVEVTGSPDGGLEPIRWGLELESDALYKVRGFELVCDSPDEIAFLRTPGQRWDMRELLRVPGLRETVQKLPEEVNDAIAYLGRTAKA